MSSLLSALANQASSTLATGQAPARLGNAHPSIAPYELFDARDRPFVIAVGNDRQFGSLVEVLGCSGLASDARFTSNQLRVHHRSELRALLVARLGERDAREWVALLTEARVPAGLVNTMSPRPLPSRMALASSPLLSWKEERGNRCGRRPTPSACHGRRRGTVSRRRISARQERPSAGARAYPTASCSGR